MRTFLQKQKWVQGISLILFFLPFFSLILNAFSWLRYGIDVPCADEWAEYLNGTLNSFNFYSLISTVNDSMSPLYKILNALAYYYLDANSVAYQFISMLVILGSILFLQWKLLSLVLVNKLVRASIFSLSLLSLQPDTYWGNTSGAFIQALPLIFMLAIIYIVVRVPWRNSLNYSMIFILGFLSGFSYISGAFGTLALSLVFILISRFGVNHQRQILMRAALVLLIPALVTVLAQFWILIAVQHGIHTGTAFSLPIEKYFWLYILGKVARSLMLNSQHPYLALTAASTASLLSLIAVYWSIEFIARNSKAMELKKTAIIYLSLISTVFVYLSLVAAGRVYLFPSGKLITNLDMFTYGFPRFHYFWITVLWPWVITVFFHQFNEKTKFYLMANFIGLILIIYAGALNHPYYYKENSEQRAKGLKCLIEHASLENEIRCPDLYSGDLKEGLINAVLLNAAFTRSIPFQLSPIALERKSPEPLFRLGPNNFHELVINNAKGEMLFDEIYRFKAANEDPQLIINIGDFEQTRKCRVLEVGASIKVAQTSTAQLFYLTQDQSVFTELASLSREIKTLNQFETIYFRMTNQNGFNNSIRLDPTNKKQPFELKNIVVRCRLDNKQFSYK